MQESQDNILGLFLFQVAPGKNKYESDSRFLLTYNLLSFII